ncbi:hypothetical protein PG997_005294 [Apiospora hydei]|uniref:Uncharacterized protein n=1 Tax=Apiospora hydei TaxID=1337664 RepID=A0ABR1X4I8_9PEZI
MEDELTRRSEDLTFEAARTGGDYRYKGHEMRRSKLERDRAVAAMRARAWASQGIVAKENKAVEGRLL